LREIESNAEDRYVDPIHQALVHLGLGEPERTLELIQRAYEIQSPMLGEVVRDPRFAPIGADPRFAEVARGMGLYDLIAPPKG
jgi:hypothetical protein